MKGTLQGGNPVEDLLLFVNGDVSSARWEAITAGWTVFGQHRTTALLWDLVRLLIVELTRIQKGSFYGTWELRCVAIVPPGGKRPGLQAPTRDLEDYFYFAILQMITQNRQRTLRRCTCCGEFFFSRTRRKFCGVCAHAGLSAAAKRKATADRVRKKRNLESLPGKVMQWKAAGVPPEIIDRRTQKLSGPWRRAATPYRSRASRGVAIVLHGGPDPLTRPTRK